MFAAKKNIWLSLIIVYRMYRTGCTAENYKNAIASQTYAEEATNEEGWPAGEEMK